MDAVVPVVSAITQLGLSVVLVVYLIVMDKKRESRQAEINEQRESSLQKRIDALHQFNTETLISIIKEQYEIQKQFSTCIQEVQRSLNA